jgi:hypothetical protein
MPAPNAGEKDLLFGDGVFLGSEWLIGRREKQRQKSIHEDSQREGSQATRIRAASDFI